MKHWIKGLFAGAVLALALFGVAAAGPFEDGEGAYGRGDYAEAMRLWRPLAEQGDTAAQNMLGVMYDTGRGVPHDYTEAIKWYRRAGDQGFGEAQYNLGWMYENGRGVSRDYAEATKWYRLAADQENAGAQKQLGVIYASGEGVPQDYAEAAKWFRRLGDHDGHPRAQMQLGLMYVTGQGVPQDYILAYMWLSLAVAQPNADAQLDADAQTARNEIAAKMTPAQIAEAQRMALEWVPKTNQTARP